MGVIGRTRFARIFQSAAPDPNQLRETVRFDVLLGQLDRVRRDINSQYAL
jgi:hypothetical protein